MYIRETIINGGEKYDQRRMENRPAPYCFASRIAGTLIAGPASLLTCSYE